MANILFTWELGEGTGHTAPYIELISKLEANGHRVSFAVRSLHKAHEQFGGMNTAVYQAPMVLPRHVDVVMPINSYPKILHNNGYDNASRLSGMIAAWINLYALIDPDIMVFDYSPTAMLAAKDSRAHRIAIGTGFHLPPDVRPMPYLQSDDDSGQDEKQLLDFEDNVLRTINEALRLSKLTPLTRFAELLDADEKFLRTLPEMDHYDERPGAKYVGILKSPRGDDPVWPSGSGPKVFAYLKPFRTLPMLLETLNYKKYPALIFGDRIPAEIERKFASESLRFVQTPLDMDAVGQTADVAICNASHGTTTQLLLSGIPILLLPLHAEQSLVARNVVRLGAGLAAPQLRPKSMELKLDMLCSVDRYRAAAQKFSSFYCGFTGERLTNAILESINTWTAPDNTMRSH